MFFAIIFVLILKTENPVEQFQHLTHSSLVDMLAEHTLRYSKLHRDGGSKEEQNNCLQILEHLTSEIQSRKRKELLENATIGTPQFIPSAEQNSL